MIIPKSFEVNKNATNSIGMHSDSLFSATNLSDPANFRRVKDDLAVRPKSNDIPGSMPDKPYALDPNNEQQFSQFVAKTLRTELNLPENADSKAVVDGYIRAEVDAYKHSTKPIQSLVQRENGLDPNKSYSDNQLQQKFTTNLKKYFDIQSGPKESDQLEGKIVQEMFLQYKALHMPRD